MKSDYSEKEFAMIKALSPLWAEIIESNCDSSLTASTILNRIAHNCFIDNTQGPAADSLRRCLKEMDAGTVYRMTKEYDNLISLSITSTLTG